MSTALRAATPEDAEAIAAIWARGWRDGHEGFVPAALSAYRSLDDFRRLVPPRIARTTVAIADGNVVGFTTLAGTDEIEQVYVAESARGSGVAAALLAHGEATIATRAPRAWLAVVAGNLRARRFYERCGWGDAGALEYEAEIEGGTLTVPCRRYEKALGAAG
jgi:GNAT superfamily N-acetyltransferase